LEKFGGESLLLTEIGADVFRKSGLVEVALGAAVTKVGPGSFRRYRQLRWVTFAKESALNLIGQEAFQQIESPYSS
jgi:hypothetical protein